MKRTRNLSELCKIWIEKTKPKDNVLLPKEVWTQIFVFLNNDDTNDLEHRIGFTCNSLWKQWKRYVEHHNVPWGAKMWIDGNKNTCDLCKEKRCWTRNDKYDCVKCDLLNCCIGCDKKNLEVIEGWTTTKKFKTALCVSYKTRVDSLWSEYWESSMKVNEINLLPHDAFSDEKLVESLLQTLDVCPYHFRKADPVNTTFYFPTKDW